MDNDKELDDILNEMDVKKLKRMEVIKNAE
jgi:hypothetical protein